LTEEPLGDTHHTTPGVFLASTADPAGNVLPEQNDARVAAHFEPHCLVERCAESLDRHGVTGAVNRRSTRRCAGRCPREGAPRARARLPLRSASEPAGRSHGAPPRSTAPDRGPCVGRAADSLAPPARAPLRPSAGSAPRP